MRHGGVWDRHCDLVADHGRSIAVVVAMIIIILICLFIIILLVVWAIQRLKRLMELAFPPIWGDDE
jgi:hypothetical protein